MRKYLILKKLSSAKSNPFTELASAGGGEFHLPFEVSSELLTDPEVGDARRNPNNLGVVLSIPFTLIEPIEDSSVGPAGPTAWGVEAVAADTSPQSGEGVTVAVLDTGIDLSHPAFQGLVDHADLMDFSANEQGVSGAAPDLHGHGTHVAGTLFGNDVNGTRIGIARRIKRALIGKVLGPQGGSTEAILNAIQWALSRRADVISMSLGIDFPGLVEALRHEFPPDIAASRALEGYRANIRLFDRIAALVDAYTKQGWGSLLVAASGNESRRNDNVLFTVAAAPPSAADGFIPVGACSRDPAVVAPFSNTGCLFSAPGVGILSAKLGGRLKGLSGTSMATPHAAGVMALWIQKLFPHGDRPKNWARDVQRAVEYRVKALPGQSRDDVGLGMVQAPQ